MKKRFKKIYVEITNICNLNCEFCEPDDREKEYMTKENFEYILEQIKVYTDYIYLHIKGEPLMHPKINEFIDMAYIKGFNINITTNGTLIDNLKTKNIRQINYSMQSTDNIDNMRVIISKLKKLIENTNIYLSLRLWSDKSKRNTDILNMLKKEFGDNIKVEDKKAIDKNIFISIENEFVWPDIESQNENIEGYCHGLKDHIAVLVDGKVVPCCLDHKGAIELGNVFSTSIDEILNSKRAIDIIEGFKNREAKEELCKKCIFKNKF